MKVSLEQVEATLMERKIDHVKVVEIIKDLTQAIEEEKEEKQSEKVPKAKWEYLIVLNDPDGKIKDEITGWVIQQQEGQDSGMALGKLTDAARAQNESAKRKKSRITSFAELFQCVKSKFTKEKGMHVKTKEPVRVFVVNGKTL
jgi:hypothetical protein